MIFCYSEDDSEDRKDGSIIESMLSIVMGMVVYEIIRNTIDDVEETS